MFPAQSYYTVQSGPSTPFKLSSPFYQDDTLQKQQQEIDFNEQLRYNALSQLNSNFISPVSVSPRESLVKAPEEYRFSPMFGKVNQVGVNNIDEFFPGVYINPIERPSVNGGVSDPMGLIDTPEAMDEDEDDEEDDEENDFLVDEDEVDMDGEMLYTNYNQYGDIYQGYNAFDYELQQQQEQIPLTINPAELTTSTPDSYDEFLGSSSYSISSDDDYESIYQPRRLDDIIIPDVITPPEEKDIYIKQEIKLEAEEKPIEVQQLESQPSSQEQQQQLPSQSQQKQTSSQQPQQSQPQSQQSQSQPKSYQVTPHSQPTHTSLISTSTIKKQSKPSAAKRRYKATHQPHPPFKCDMKLDSGDQCGKVFSRPYDLTRHKDTIHASVRKTFTCEHCGDSSKTFSRMDALTRHIRVKHSS